MTPRLALSLFVRPAATLLGDRFKSPEAEVLMLAIALQESGLRARRQMPVAHARGFWQFEQGGGVRGVLSHPASKTHAERLCSLLVYPSTTASVYEALADNDLLAAGFARLLLWTDPHPLPPLGNHDAAWTYYMRTWRPGKPWPLHWPDNYRTALAALD
jgi:hypothetical protein